MATSTQDLWTAARSGDEHAREQIVAHHVELVRKIAARLYASRTDQIADFNDYLHYGMVGLLESLERYDGGDRGASFATYAGHRIRGSILNGLSKASERRQLAAHRARLGAERARSLAPDPDRKHADAFADMVETTLALAVGALLEQTAAASHETPYTRAAMAQARKRIGSVLERLPERERLILRQHYFERIAFADIAASLGVTRGRVSQLHSRGIQRIREQWASDGELDDYA